MRSKGEQKGFTLIEVITASVIVALALAFVAVSFPPLWKIAVTPLGEKPADRLSLLSALEDARNQGFFSLPAETALVTFGGKEVGRTVSWYAEDSSGNLFSTSDPDEVTLKKVEVALASDPSSSFVTYISRPSEAHPANLLANPSFEAYTGTPNDSVGDAFTSWVPYSEAVGRNESVTTDKSEGQAAVRFVQTSAPGTAYYQGLYQEIDLASKGIVPGDLLSGAITYKVGSNPNSPFYCSVFFKDSGGAVIGSTVGIADSQRNVSEWTTAEREGIVVPAGAATVRFQVFLRSDSAFSGSEWVAVDSALLVKGETVPSILLAGKGHIGTYGQVSGTVTGPSGSALSGVQVTAVGGNVEPKTTDASGKYAFSYLLTGPVSLRFSKDRYLPQTAELVVSKDRAMTQDVVLPFDPAANSAPTVSLSAAPTSGVIPFTTTLTATAQDPDGDSFRYDWEFGDGTVKPNGSWRESHTYNSQGTYTARVAVTDERNATASATTTVRALKPVQYVVSRYAGASTGHLSNGSYAIGAPNGTAAHETTKHTQTWTQTLSSFGFDSLIPVGATINGVTLNVWEKIYSTYGDSSISYQVVGKGTPVVRAGNINQFSPPQTIEFGSGFTRNDLLNANFSVNISGTSHGNSDDDWGFWDLDAVQVTVRYTAYE